MSKAPKKENERFERIYCAEIKNYFEGLKKRIVKEWGNKALYDNEITDIGQQLIGKKYVGTFPIDRVPLSGTDKYMIVNADKSGLPGSHWLGVYLKGDTVFVYDSFARKSKKLLKPLHDKAKKYKKKIIDINAKSDQKNHTEICGPISLSFLYIVKTYGIDAGRCV